MKRLLGLFVLALFTDCSSTATPPPASGAGPQLLPGEDCVAVTDSSIVKMRFDPPRVVVAPGAARSVRMIVDPDLCAPTHATFTSSSEAVARPPAAAALDLRHATYDFSVAGAAAGTATITSTMPSPVDGSPITATLEVDVRDAARPTCAKGPGASQTMDGQHTTLSGAGDLSTASLAAPATAFARTDEMVLPSFPADLACGDDLTGAPAPALTAGLLPLGPAVTFTAHAPLSMAKSLRRELDFAIPVNPAAMPPAARLRHVQVLFSSPRAKTPRPIAVANPRIEQSGSGYVFKFSSPWFGTYQAAVAPDAGTHHYSRRITHRAIAGISMGAVGSSTFGLRHHDQFDAIAPLGGPADWTWLLWYIETYALGGFCPETQPSCPKYAPNMYPMNEVFAHTMDFNHLWYQPGGGNGGGFARDSYLQIFLDLAVMLGNASGGSADPAIPFFPRGVKSTDPWVVGDTTGMPAGMDCRLTVDPIKDDPLDPLKGVPTQAQEQTWWDQCNHFRCALDSNGRMIHGWVAPQGYYDAKFNPQGKYPVISFCDGVQTQGASPYQDQWAPPTSANGIPVSIALAVDKNGNGVRDEDEPVLGQGHEHFEDDGIDGVADAKEPGYDPETNPDPNQDDYDFQLNPNGTEGDHRYELGEPFDDFGLDGVPLTASLNVAGDVGEGDGVYTESAGLKSFYAADVHSMVHQWVTDLPGGPLTDDALRRVDIWADGGVRDLFNFVSTANHLMGAVSGRRVRTTAYYDNFDALPGETFGKPLDYQPSNVLWADVADNATMRYGIVDATPHDIQNGDGQHVGTADQILHRLQTAFFFAARSWTDTDRTYTNPTSDNPETTTINELGTTCEITGRCQTYFTGPATHRTGPIAVSLPPGYANEDNRKRDVRYPVLYLLHGYGQDPRDLEATAILVNNFMNDGTRSYASRLPKTIVVYVDGRCRIGPDGKPECVRGTFWEHSTRQGGADMDSWFEEVMQYIDKNYRTMGETTLDVTE